MGIRKFKTSSRAGSRTPLVAGGGKPYKTGSWSVVSAIDTQRTGKQLWRWDPQVPRAVGQKVVLRDVVKSASVAPLQGQRVCRHAGRAAGCAERQDGKTALAGDNR